MMRSIFMLAVLTAATTAHADNVRPTFSASAGTLAGAGFNGLSVGATGLNVIAGLRHSKVVSTEIFFDAWFDATQHLEPAEGAECSGLYTDQWHWQTLGVRMWAHLTHDKHVDFAIAPPWLAAGFAIDHGRSASAPGGMCYRGPRDKAGAMIVIGLIGVAFEIRFAAWLSIRLAAGGELDLAQDAGLGILSLTGSVGPSIRF